MREVTVEEAITMLENLAKDVYNVERLNAEDVVCNGHRISIADSKLWHEVVIDNRYFMIRGYVWLTNEDLEHKHIKALDYIKRYLEG